MEGIAEEKCNGIKIEFIMQKQINAILKYIGTPSYPLTDTLLITYPKVYICEVMMTNM